jgi:hypothetical protein
LFACCAPPSARVHLFKNILQAQARHRILQAQWRLR